MLWGGFATGNLDRSLLTPQMNAAMTPELLAQTAPQFQALGGLNHLTPVQRNEQSGGVACVYAAQFAAGSRRISIFVTADGKVGGYWLLP
jgi:hypothetical protein